MQRDFIEFRAFIEPQQGARYANQIAVAQSAEQLGFAAFFRSDHYLAMSGDGIPGPTDSWVTLGAIARETSSIRLGTLVTSTTFRHPGPLAIAVAQVDEMSAGRVEFGLGSGWFEKEHQAYGIPFPPCGSDSIGSANSWPSSRDCGRPNQVGPSTTAGSITPSPAHQRCPNRRSEFNVPFASIDVAEKQYQRVAQAVAVAGRPDDSMVYSSAFLLCAGRRDREVARRAAAIGRDLDELRSNSPLVGTPAEIVDDLGAWKQIGVQRVYAQLLDLTDLALLVWYSACGGYASTARCHHCSRSGPSSSRALSVTTFSPSCSVTSGWAFRLKYHDGCAGAPPFDATMA